MLTLSELAERTGYSRDQLKRRLARLGAQLNGDVRRGAHGKLLVSERVAEILSELKALEDQGLGLSEALRALQLAPQSAPQDTEGVPEHTPAPMNTIPVPVAVLWAMAVSCGVSVAALVAIALALWLR